MYQNRHRQIHQLVLKLYYLEERKRSMGTKLKNLRKKSNMSQEDLAYLVGCEREKISRYENNRIKKPDYFFVCKIADIFNVTTDYFRKDTKKHDNE